MSFLRIFFGRLFATDSPGPDAARQAGAEFALGQIGVRMDFKLTRLAEAVQRGAGTGEILRQVEMLRRELRAWTEMPGE